MNSPFRVGDTIYHATHGRGEIVSVNMPNHVKDNGRTILVCFEKSPFLGRVFFRQYSTVELSFTPWPKPNHERPLEKGWWVVKGARDYLLISFWDGASWWYREDGKMWVRTHECKPVHFISKHIEGVNT